MNQPFRIARKAFLLFFTLGLLLPAPEAAALTAPTQRSEVATTQASLFKKRRRNRANRRGFLGLFRKKSGGCGCPSH